MNFEPSLLLDVLVAIAACGGAYAAIRADLARLHARVDVALLSADKAHARIDALHVALKSVHAD